ncbi:hypothetical protein SAMN06265795_103173 [Noviherbaspirillum humi]|uniref:Uncharacterized protein n=2 Tax=Noviherbaspirillum humi TaxID=1688639 RepID=A0A239F6B1_9BURK|nr:hypothetical protein SAMN06265795_103173 [Noviherbaspirillum humi]
MLVREAGEPPFDQPAIVFSETTSPGLVPLWEAVGIYDLLYNSDGCMARDVSRDLAYGLDRIIHEPALARMLPPAQGGSMSEAVRFLENVVRGCTRHASARIQTS